MQEQLVKLAKEKHFEGLFKKEWEYNTKESLRYYFWMCELQKWLREKYKLVVIISYQYEFDSTPYSYWIYKKYNSLPINQWIDDLKTYEEALELGLLEALKLI